MAEHPPYEVTSHAQAKAWRKWTYDATDELLLAALRGAGDSWETVPARECSDELKQRGYVLVGAYPHEVDLERKPTPRTLPGERVPAYEGQEGIDWFHEDDVRADNPDVQLDEE